MKRRLALRAAPLAGALLWGALAGGRALAQAPAIDKADLVKVSVIEKVVRFIDWPPMREAQFFLCAPAEHPQMSALKAYYENVTIGDKPVSVQAVKRGDRVPCRVLFMAPADLSQPERIRGHLERGQTLLIAEGADAAAKGVHIAFYIDAGRLKLEVNRKSLETSGLKASFRLLEVARVVD
ncbi:MAG: YfiR family protein [Betaproteobacteria bacterium]|nr:YfiR family protein [Betaproteobacteria bacterium]